MPRSSIRRPLRRRSPPRKQHFGRAEVAAAIEHFFGELARILADRGVRRIVVGGGETSGAIVEALGVRSLRIGSEIDPGVPGAGRRPRRTARPGAEERQFRRPGLLRQGARPDRLGMSEQAIPAFGVVEQVAQGRHGVRSAAAAEVSAPRLPARGDRPVRDAWRACHPAGDGRSKHQLQPKLAQPSPRNPRTISSHSSSSVSTDGVAPLRRYQYPAFDRSPSLRCR